jgi:hypothetical protein
MTGYFRISIPLRARLSEPVWPENFNQERESVRSKSHETIIRRWRNLSVPFGHRDRDGRVDEPAATERHRVSARRESSAARATGNRRLRFNDDQRRRLAARAKGFGRKLLSEVATLVTPKTLLAGHRKLIAQRYDGHDKCGPGRPRI